MQENLEKLLQDAEETLYVDDVIGGKWFAGTCCGCGWETWVTRVETLREDGDPHRHCVYCWASSCGNACDNPMNHDMPVLRCVVASNHISDILHGHGLREIAERIIALGGKIVSPPKKEEEDE